MITQTLTREDLLCYILSGSKPESTYRIGLEYEKFGLVFPGAKPLPFNGNGGVQVILENIASNGFFEKCYEKEKLTELHSKTSSIFLEPGGQVELSSTPWKDLHAAKKELQSHVSDLLQASSQHPIAWFSMGVHPFSSIEEVEWMPKGRYQLLSRFLDGSLSHAMMKQTASLQVNIDFKDEKDALFKFRLAMALAPILIALFANSPIYQGVVTPFLSYRAHIWQHTDSKRCGMIQNLFNPDYSLEEYVDWALSLPMIFIKREDQWISIHKTFAEYLESGYEIYQPTLDDWALHLSTIFTEARLKKIIEIRSADSHQPSMALALMALIAGLFYNASTMQSAWELVHKWSWPERMEVYREVPRLGLQTWTKKGKIRVLADQVIKLSELGLDQRGVGEAIYLEPLKRLIKKGKTVAEESIELFRKSPEDWVEYHSLKKENSNGR